MSLVTAHNPSPLSGAFVEEARRNLLLLRAVYGADSARYIRLAQSYREVATELGCRRALERVLHALNTNTEASCDTPLQR